MESSAVSQQQYDELQSKLFDDLKITDFAATQVTFLFD